MDKEKNEEINEEKENEEENESEVYIEIEQLFYSSANNPDHHLQFNRFLNPAGFDQFKINFYDKDKLVNDFIFTGAECLEFAMGMKKIVLNALIEKTDFMAENAINEAMYSVAEENNNEVI